MCGLAAIRDRAAMGRVADRYHFRGPEALAVRAWRDG